MRRVHFFQDFLLQVDMLPGVTKGIEKGAFAAAIDWSRMGGWAFHASATARRGERIHVGDTERQVNRGMPRVFTLKRPPSGHSSPAGMVDSPILI